ncbi:hypothetical protein [Xenorhabdus lircayensis]|uniref:Uncharacterized protein n=1 Tax=Xenorhabdus lircayensis TaxID=2763499 RepID=A0ABS0U2T9_9GAMM|nr:hypothetical protein [Xenorhabdus lircayensis]MBI6547253.1 hypothetical protein [Xenorhabdus lircayensis]
MKDEISACDYACSLVAEAYLLHLVATWRRPVYRYETGDIEVCRYFLWGLLDGYPKERMNDGYRARFYSKLLKETEVTPIKGAVICGGKIPQLSKRGLKYMNALVHQYCDMLIDIGVQDEHGMLTLPESYNGIRL